jgi:DNA-binding IclR family transcriptional regulator
MTSSDAGSLKRGVLLLRLLATAGSRGLALTDIAARATLPHPSAHRVLKQLLDERLVEHNPESRRYRLGPLAFELGLAGSAMFDIRDLCEPQMRALAEASADTVYLVMRSGFDAVCVHRLEGNFPIRTLVLDVGSRRPLGVGAGGLAILAAIEAHERAEIIERVAPGLKAFGGLTAPALAKACEQARQAGASVIQDTVNLGVSAVGVAFRDAMGQSTGALSVAGLSQRMTRQRMRDVASALKLACREVEQNLRAHQRGGWRAGGGAG